VAAVPDVLADGPAAAHRVSMAVAPDVPAVAAAPDVPADGPDAVHPAWVAAVPDVPADDPEAAPPASDIFHIAIRRLPQLTAFIPLLYLSPQENRPGEDRGLHLAPSAELASQIFRLVGPR
jgi:hypothetical protein